ncbi:MAG: hypothetical protein QOH73_1401 [Gaiellaceae bacterium]|jgi:hypothetical protein|nr:hypothetical protein [Gaiellaceae bacterium]
MHYLALSGRAPELARAYAGEGEVWPAFRAALVEHRAFVSRFVDEQNVQTNEVQRCYGLLPAFLTLASEAGRPLDLIELGPSAGLNLLWDRYRYVYGEETWGAADAPLALEGGLRASLPAGLLDVAPVVRSRIGIDLSPVDVTTEEGSLLLQCFVWVGQMGRLERLRHAIAALRHDPPQLLRGDYVDLLPELLAERDPEALTVVFETASTMYLSTEQRARLDEALDEAGASGSLAFLTTTQPDDESHSFWALRLRTWPGGERLLAHMDFHGAWVEWLAK